MRARIAAPLAWSLWALSVASAVFGLFLLYLNGSFAPFFDESLGVDAAIAVAFPTVGAIIASRRPGNRIGWIFCAVGLSGGASILCAQYGVYALVTNRGSLPAGVVATWIGTWLWLPSVILAITFVLLLFPHGRLLSPRWRPVAWLAAAATVAGAALVALTPWDLLDPGVPAQYPFGIEGLRDVGVAIAIPIFVVVILAMLLSIVSLVLRFRRSRGEERQQLKWFVYAGVLSVGTLLLPTFDAASLLQLVSMPLLPAAAGVAILRYRLYDIDRIINRTLVYGVLTVTLVLLYLGSVIGLQYVLRALTGQESQLAVVASTLAIAALFNPVRRLIQAFVDRRFYRSKYDAAKTLAAFGTRLREETDLDRLGGELVSVVRETLQPQHASLWLRRSGRVGEEER